MPNDLLTRIRGEIDARMRQLAPVAEEIQRLEAALRALDRTRANGRTQTTTRRRSPASAGTAATPSPRRGTKRAPRGANRQAILKVIEERPDASSGEIASKTGMAKPTLYTTLRSLVKEGIVEKRDAGGVSGYHLKAIGAKRPTAPVVGSARKYDGVAKFRLQFPMSEIEALAARYDFDSDDDVAAAGAAARVRGYYTKPELVLICAWKTARSKSRVAKNTDASVESTTRAAFATEDESERMAALCALQGVEAPTASVLLHFAFPDRYPIIDWRALESLGEPQQAAYSTRYWLSYVNACRKLAKEAGVTMRVLDKALWQHSRERER